MSKSTPSQTPASTTPVQPEPSTANTWSAVTASPKTAGKKRNAFSLFNPASWTLRSAIGWVLEQTTEVAGETFLIKKFVQPHLTKTAEKAAHELFGASEDAKAQAILAELERSTRIALMRKVNALSTYQRKYFINELVRQVYSKEEGVDDQKKLVIDDTNKAAAIKVLTEIAETADEEEAWLAAGVLYARPQDFTVRGIPHHIASAWQHIEPVYDAMDEHAEKLARAMKKNRKKRLAKRNPIDRFFLNLMK
jgi:hypothetical protein